MKFKKASKITVTIMLVTTLVLAVGAATLGAYTAPTPLSHNLKTTQQQLSTGETPYMYSQSGYYQGAYIFELGWNLNENSLNDYTENVDLTLSDKTTITVFFDRSCKSQLQNQAMLSDLKNLIEKLKVYHVNLPPLQRPLVVSINYIGDSDFVKLAEEYYTNGELTKFSAIFSVIDLEVQHDYCTKMIEDGKTAFLSSSAKHMNIDLLDYCSEKTYQEDKIALFSCIVPCLTDTQKQVWVTRASADNKNTFLSVLTE